METRFLYKVFFIVSALTILSLFADAHARGIEVMKDPIELFFAEPGKITRAQAKSLVSEVLRKSNEPRWTRRKGRHGVIRAEAKRGRMHAAIDIHIDNVGIKINYADSQRMRFRERQDKKYIRDIYNKWVMSFSKELKRLAEYRYRLKLVNARKRKIMKGLASGKALVVIAVRALPDYRPKQAAAKWSAQIGESLAKVLNNKRGAKHVFLTLEWNRETINYVRRGYKKVYNKQACDAYESQGVITVGVVVDQSEEDKTASEELAITYFNCKTEQLVVKTVYADYKNDDAFDLKTATIFHVDKLLNEVGF